MAKVPLNSSHSQQPNSFSEHRQPETALNFVRGSVQDRGGTLTFVLRTALLMFFDLSNLGL